ncbi:195_t:CDS:10, partial [Acaulospora morrowiae]
SLDSTERQASASGFISHLHDKYEEHLKSKVIPPLISNEDFAGVTEYLERCCGADVAYALIRLTRGLASSRAGARHGFSLALIELLAGLKGVTYKIVATLINEACPIKSSKDRENSDYIFGRVFGFMAIIQSGILWRKGSTKEDYIEIIDNLITCSKCKSYVREACYHIIISSIPHLKGVSFEESAISHLITVLKGSSEHGIHNPDDVNLALSIESQYPPNIRIYQEIVQADDWKNAILHRCDSCVIRWQSPKIMSSDNIAKLAVAIQASSSTLAAEIHQNQENRLHSVWNTIVQSYNHEDRKKMRDRSIEFEEFWKLIVDDQIFGVGRTRRRIYWGFQLFVKVLTTLPTEKISALFTKNFMHTLISNLHHENRRLHRASLYVLNAIINVSKIDKSKAMVVIKTLLGPNCDQDFDVISNTKTIKKIFRNMDFDELENVLSYLKKNFLEPNQSDVDTMEDRRQWIINYMYLILKDTQMGRDESWMKFILDMFLLYGFFTSKKSADVKKKNAKLVPGKNSTQIIFEEPKPPLSEKTQECCRTRLFHALGELITIRQPKNNQNVAAGLNSIMSNGGTWAYYAACQFTMLEGDHQIDPLIDLNEEIQETKKIAFKTMQRINNKLKIKSLDNALQYEGFLLLFSFSTIMLYSEPKEAMNALQDLQPCYDKMFGTSKKSKSTDDTDDTHNPVDVIVDILLGFLAVPSYFLHAA